MIAVVATAWADITPAPYSMDDPLLASRLFGILGWVLLAATAGVGIFWLLRRRQDATRARRVRTWTLALAGSAVASGGLSWLTAITAPEPSPRPIPDFRAAEEEELARLERERANLVQRRDELQRSLREAKGAEETRRLVAELEDVRARLKAPQDAGSARDAGSTQPDACQCPPGDPLCTCF